MRQTVQSPSTTVAPGNAHLVRRSAAVVSTDVVGYSTQIALASQRTIKKLKEYDDWIVGKASSHDGNLFARAGDSWLVEFTTADSAVSFALDLQTRFGSGSFLPLRTGIHFGELIVYRGMTHGSAINIAVRLQAIAQPGGFTLSAAVLKRISRDFGIEFREIGPRVLKNIPDLVDVYRVVLTTNQECPSREPAGLVDLGQPVAGLAGRPAIAVLSFRNTAEDPKLAYFAEGLSEDLIDSLSRARWLPVISRNSSLQLHEQLADFREIGRRLGARYLVDGDVFISDRNLEVQVSLIEAEDRHVVWTKRYLGEPRDLFALRDEIANGIAAAIDPELSRAEQFRSRTKPVETLDDWELVRRGTWHMNRLTRQDAELAFELFEQALSRNPESVEALIHLAWCHFWKVWVERGATEQLVEMARLARQAAMLDPSDARAVMLTGIAAFMQGDAAHGCKLLQRAIQLNPSLAVAHASVGSTHILAGQPELAIEPLQIALRLSPSDFYLFHTFGEVAAARHMMGEYELAIVAAQEALRLRPGYFYAHVVRVGSLARLGRIDQARGALTRFLERRPTFKRRDIDWLPFTSRYWPDHLLQGLNLAGYNSRGDNVSEIAKPTFSKDRRDSDQTT